MKRKYSFSEKCCIFLTFVITVFFVWNMGVIVWKGFPALGEALSSEEVKFSLRLSFLTATLSSCIILTAAIPCAYALTRLRFPSREMLRLSLELPMFLPYLVLGLSLLYVFSSDFGKMLKALGFQVVFDWKGIVFAQIIVNFPVVIYLLTGVFERCDRELEDTAKTMGASNMEAFMKIALPMHRGHCISAFLLAWARGIGEFGATLMLVGVTRMKTETLPGCIYLNISTGDEEEAMAAAFILLAAAAVLLALRRVAEAASGKQEDTVEKRRVL